MNDSTNIEPNSITLPYAAILQKLLKSVMLAQLEIVKAIEETSDVEQGLAKVSNKDIDKHFFWLTQRVHNFHKLGIDRHIFNAPDTDWAGVVGLREAFGVNKRRAGKPTRISYIVRQSFGGLELSGRTIKLTSPLRIVLNILSDPNAPGSSSYPLVTIRSYIFEALNAFPEMKSFPEANPDHSEQDFSPQTFSIDSVIESLGRIWTSFQPRAESLGKDPISHKGRDISDSVVRTWLALKGLALLFFNDIEKCTNFLENDFYPSVAAGVRYELQKSPWVSELPDVGSIVNELWGLPVAIRGADVLFRGGLRFPESGGLVIAIHGDPGAGKTSLALALGAHFIPFGIKTLFVTADGKEADLRAKVTQMIPDRIRRLSFFPDKKTLINSLIVSEIEVNQLVKDGTIKKLLTDLKYLSQKIGRPNYSISKSAPLPCHGMIVLDGLHDLFSEDDDNSLKHIYELIATFRSLNMLVILTSGSDWDKNIRLDYLVDISMKLEQEKISEYGSKPDRRLTLTKTRHQLSALGKHGFRLDGRKGVRMSPQINYGLDLRSIYLARLPNQDYSLRAVSKVTELGNRSKIPKIGQRSFGRIKDINFIELPSFVDFYSGSHVFINGRGSSGKAGLALKMAFSPSLPLNRKDKTPHRRFIPHGIFSNVLIISFLYPEEYYRNLCINLLELQKSELASEFNDYLIDTDEATSIDNNRLKVIHLYPGYLRPDDLFNKIAWEIETSDLNGLPYSSVVIDGLHNVPIQFPELEKHSLLWPQLYKFLRTRDLTVITTHTMLEIHDADNTRDIAGVDDRRSEPLRHALVHKTDFQIEIDPLQLDTNFNGDFDDVNMEDLFCVRVLSAIGQPFAGQKILWSRNQLVLFEDNRDAKNNDRSTQGTLPI